MKAGSFLRLLGATLALTASALAGIRQLEDWGREPLVLIGAPVRSATAAGTGEQAPACTAPSRPTNPCDFIDCNKRHTGEIA